MSKTFFSWGSRKEMKLKLEMLRNQGLRKSTQSVDSDERLGIRKRTDSQY